MHENDRLGSTQAVDIGLDRRREILRHLLIMQPLVPAEQGVKILLIEIKSIDAMAAGIERRQYGLVERPVEARLNRMRVNDQNPHQAAPCSPENSQTRPELKSKSGFSQPIILPGLSIPCGSASFLKASCARSVRFMPPSS